MIFLALLYAALSLHRIIENLKTDLVATRASARSRERLSGDWERRGVPGFSRGSGSPSEITPRLGGWA